MNDEKMRVQQKLEALGKLVSVSDIVDVTGVSKAGVSHWCRTGIAGVGRLCGHQMHLLHRLVIDGVLTPSVTQSDVDAFRRRHPSARMAFRTQHVISFLEITMEQHDPSELMRLLTKEFPQASQLQLSRLLKSKYGVTKSRTWVGMHLRKHYSKKA